jgi:dihydroxy-acid dehydratase
MSPVTTDDATSEMQNGVTEGPKYVQFPCVPDDATRDGKPVLNRYSSFITNGHDFPGAQVI